MSAHIVGRPDDDFLDIILGGGADPEQAFIRGSEQRRAEGGGVGEGEGEGVEDHLRSDQPTMPEQ